ncbi:MAG: hypothetical protein K0S16_2095 [Moraxellaceae bacterium]|jgi:hypothetical protein|nr:hypothetical protein [Moraxellaceae bacterium]
MPEPPPSGQPRLPRELKRDILLDTLGNIALALGLWGWLGDDHGWNAVLRNPQVFIPLTATGVLNLLHLPARLRRLRDWRGRQQ